MSAVATAIYKPVSLASSVLGGVAAGVVFRQIYKRIGDDDSAAPNPKDLDRTVWDVLIAATIQGAIFGLVKAAVDRVGANGYRAVTHQNPT